MTQQAEVRVRQHGNPYNIFILVLTIMSLAIMVAMLLPVTPEEQKALLLYDNLACVIFLVDFAYNLTGSTPKSAYFIKGRGWIDLLGSIPSFGVFQITVLLRLFRLFRLARVARLLRGNNKKQLVEDIVKNRGQYALFVTLLLIFIVLTTASLLVLQFESRGGGSIRTAGDAIWFSIVTITTVGYGDFYPITPGGRAVAVAVMFSGVAVIGALASILASILVTSGASAGASEAIEQAATADGAAPGGEPADAPSAGGAPSSSGAALIPAAADASARVAAALAVQRGEAVIADPAADAPADASAVSRELVALREEIAELRRHLTKDVPTDPPPTA